jgi:hypothetical protein
MSFSSHDDDNVIIITSSSSYVTGTYFYHINALHSRSHSALSSLKPGCVARCVAFLAFYATGADGVRRMWRVAGTEVAPGAWARVNAAEPGVSMYIDAEGVSVEGVPAEQAGGGAAGAGRRRLLDGGTGQGVGCSDCQNAGCQCISTASTPVCIYENTFVQLYANSDFRANMDCWRCTVGNGP